MVFPLLVIISLLCTHLLPSQQAYNNPDQAKWYILVSMLGASHQICTWLVTVKVVLLSPRPSCNNVKKPKLVHRGHNGNDNDVTVTAGTCCRWWWERVLKIMPAQRHTALTFMWTNSSHPKSLQHTCIAWTQMTIFIIHTFGGKVQENSLTRISSVVCVLCCTMNFPSSLIETWMTGGEGQAHVRGVRGGKQSRTCHRHQQTREMYA
jgi:hypothetical protein